MEEERKRFGLTVHPARYDASRFAPSQYFATARKLARDAVADAELVGAMFSPVSHDGTVDLNLAAKIDGCSGVLDCGHNFYAFRSPSRSKLPDGAPSNAQPPRECAVIVFIREADVAVRLLITSQCQDALAPPPRCTLAKIWAAAEARGAPAELAARMTWSPPEGWLVSTRIRSSDPPAVFEQLLPDDC